MRPSVLSILPHWTTRVLGFLKTRGQEVSGGDLLEEPCKHMKKEQSADQVGTRQLRRHQRAECVSSTAFLPLAPDGPCARGDSRA